MTTQQPKWKLVAQLGDTSPVEYGGYFILEDTTGVYDPEGWFLQSPDTDESPEGWVLFRFTFEPCTYENGVLSDNKFHKNNPAWFADDIEQLANFIGAKPEELTTQLVTGTIVDRAYAWQSIGCYHGFDNLDSYPLTFKTRAEIDAFMLEHIRPLEIEAFAEKITPEVEALLTELVKDISDDCRASDDEEDSDPAIDITISCNNSLSSWSYQTGDNSFTGGCYGHPYWGTGTLAKGSSAKNIKLIAKNLVADMLEQIHE